MTHHIVFLDRSTLSPEIRIPEVSFEHRWEEYDKTSPDQVMMRLQDATIAVVNKVKLDRSTLASLKKLKMIAVAATGTDNIDLKACEELGITVSNIRAYAVHTVPEHTFALMLALRRNLMGYHNDVAKGEWQKVGQFCFFNHPINDLSGQTLGLIGKGAIGESVAAIARAFGMKVLFAGRKGEENINQGYTHFDQVLRESDVISLHCPLTPQTRNLISNPEFAMMNRQPIIINTARGGLIDEDALAHALRNGNIAAAGIDVSESEPPLDSSPLWELMDRPNFLLTPHIAWASKPAMQSLANQLIDNIEKFVKNRPQNVVMSVK